jgi:hypothetical protein
MFSQKSKAAAQGNLTQRLWRLVVVSGKLATVAVLKRASTMAWVASGWAPVTPTFYKNKILST